MRKKSIALMLILAMVATLMIGVLPASAASEYDCLSVKTVEDGDAAALGTVIVDIGLSSVTVDDAVVMSLPEDFIMAAAPVAPLTWADNVAAGANDYVIADAVSPYTVTVSAPATFEGDDNALFDTEADGIDFVVEQLSENQIKIVISPTYLESAGDTVAILKIQFTNVFVDSGFDGEIKASFDAQSGSCFSSGDVVIGNVPDGQVTVSVVDDETANSNFVVKLRVKENKAGALKGDNETLKFVLPDGFEWDNAGATLNAAGYEFKSIWGDPFATGAVPATNGNDLAIEDDQEECIITLLEAAESTSAVGSGAACFEFKLRYQVEDEDDADMGDVTVKVKGDSTVTPSTLVMGTYGDYGAKISIDGDVAEVYTGQTEQEIPDLVIKEDMEGSLQDGRTVLLTLPATARWQGTVNPDNGNDLGDGPFSALTGDSDSNVELEFVDFTGTEKRTAKFRVVGESTSAAELTIEDLEIATESMKTGDIAITVSGSAGIEGTVIVAKAINSATIAAEGAATDLIIGKGGQALPNVIVTEVAAGAFTKDGAILIDLPEGVGFASTPTVEVTAGDADISEFYRQNSTELTKDNQFVIQLDGETQTASTFKVSNIKVNVDRTVPEGPVYAALAGGAVNQTGGSAAKPWPNTRVMGSVVAANVVTAAPEDQKNVASFTVGSTTYKVNGVDQTMDVAPFIEDGRTFMPLRYVALAVGVPESNIMWDQAAQTVTLMKGDSSAVVQVKIGSTTMLVNGVAVTMDVAPKIVDGRTMLPLRFLANAFGLTTTWDAATNTATIQ